MATIHHEFEIGATPELAWSALREIANINQLTFARVADDGRQAILRTPAGEVDIGLETRVSREHGTIDWWMTFPDGSVGKAFSRLVDLGDGLTQYGFVLSPPPVPLERLEGTLDEQVKILAAELVALRSILEQLAWCAC